MSGILWSKLIQVKAQLLYYPSCLSCFCIMHCFEYQQRLVFDLSLVGNWFCVCVCVWKRDFNTENPNGDTDKHWELNVIDNSRGDQIHLGLGSSLILLYFTFVQSGSFLLLIDDDVLVDIWRAWQVIDFERNKSLTIVSYAMVWFKFDNQSFVRKNQKKNNKGKYERLNVPNSKNKKKCYGLPFYISNNVTITLNYM